MNLAVNENPLVSVIIPVYNVESYLERCVRSVSEQSYSNLEIIVVDDGSTDGSGEICDRLGNEDNRIQVIHQANQGLSGARNAGIDVCKGDYVCFVDSDDYIHPDYVKYLYKICVDNNCEIGVCGNIATDGSATYQEIDWNSGVEVYDRKKVFDAFYSDMHVPIVIAWNKIYRRDCIGDIRYDVGYIHEDEATTFKFLYNASRIAFGQEILYYYFNRDDSITGQAYSKKRLDILKAYENRLNFYDANGEKEFFERESQFYLSEILNHYDKVYHYLDKDRDILVSLKEKYKIVYKRADKTKWSLDRKAKPK